MSSINSPLAQPITRNFCPHLGIPADPQTVMDYPSLQNFCHHVTPIEAPGLSHQREFCLEASFTQCPLYAAKSAKPMPVTIIGESIPARKKSTVLIWMISGLIFVIVIAVAVWFGLTSLLTPSPAASNNPDVANVVAKMQTDAVLTGSPVLAIIEKPSSTVTPQLFPTVALSSTYTFTPKPPHLFKTPFGTDGRQFVLHRVVGGESLMWIAETYHTNPDAIRKVNYNLANELWADSVLVIPLNLNDVTDVIPMTAFEINVDRISVETLAKEQGINLTDLGVVNDRPLNYHFKSGEWVILPHSPVTPSPTPTLSPTPTSTRTPTSTSTITPTPTLTSTSTLTLSPIP